MPALLRKRWSRLGAGGLLMAVLGAALTLAATGGFAASASDSDQRVTLASSKVTGDLEDLPLSVDAAVSAGWTGSIRCLKGQGRYYRKLTGDQADPLMLLFDADDRLIGMNLHSASAQPSPWGHLPNGMQAGIDGRESEYWDLNIFFTSPVGACQTKSSVYSEVW